MNRIRALSLLLLLQMVVVALTSGFGVFLF
jgi:hypothetical protein